QDSESTRPDAPREFSDGPDTRREAVSGDNHSDSKPRGNEDTKENTSAEDTEEKDAAADPDQEYSYSETRAADQHASAAGAAGAASAGGSSAASGSGGSGSGGSGSGGSGKGGGGGSGWLRSLFIPLIAGVVGALIVLLLYNVFDGGDGTETADQSASEESTQEAANIEQQGGGTSEEDADTSEAIQSARQSVVSVINLQ